MTTPSPRGNEALARILGHPAKALPQLRDQRGYRQSDVARILGVKPSTTCALEGAVDPKLSTIEGYVEALGGRLVLMAVFDLPDGRLDRHLIRTRNDHRLDLPLERIVAGRWRDPNGPRPAAAARRERLAAVAAEHVGAEGQLRKTIIHRHDDEVAP